MTIGVASQSSLVSSGMGTDFAAVPSCDLRILADHLSRGAGRSGGEGLAKASRAEVGGGDGVGADLDLDGAGGGVRCGRTSGPASRDRFFEIADQTDASYWEKLGAYRALADTYFESGSERKRRGINSTTRSLWA